MDRCIGELVDQWIRGSKIRGSWIVAKYKGDHRIGFSSQ